jgi:hypothetical protein
MEVLLAEGLKEAFGWGSPVGLGVFFIGLSMLYRWTDWGRRKKE